MSAAELLGGKSRKTALHQLLYLWDELNSKRAVGTDASKQLVTAKPEESASYWSGPPFGNSMK